MKQRTNRMLIVDDEELVRRVCAKTLEGMGFYVESAANAEEAWKILNEREFDCVLTDICMPGSMDGTALTEEVKSRFPSTDILVMTGNPNLDTAVSTLKHGALDYLIKPFGATALETAVTSCFERRRLSGELNRERMLRQELEAAYAELQKLERAKDAFISILNHELRTPLTIAIAAAEALADLCVSKKTEEIVEMLRSSLDRETQVIEDLLLFSSLDPGGVAVKFSEVHLGALIADLIENYRSLWEAKKVRVEIDASVRSMAPFHGDEKLLQAAFKHLLLNAIHFNMKGGLVQIEVQDSSKRINVLISNTGLDIPPEQRVKIFDRFYQVAEHMTRSVGGLGLGLAIVRRSVEAHRGFITVDSRKGGGAEFLVSLPRNEAPLANRTIQRLVASQFQESRCGFGQDLATDSNT